MRASLIVFVLILSLTTLRAKAEDSTLTISAADATLAGQTITLDGKFVGVVGDTITLTKPVSQLLVHLPVGFYATIRLQLSGASLQASAPSGGECIQNTAVSIQGAPVPKVSGASGRFALEIPTLPLSRGGGCSSQPSTLTCAQVAAQVDVKSNPEVNAAIWVSGKDMHSTTPATISYPYCVGMTPRMDFVLRKPGFINCAVDIRADGRSAPYAVQCQRPMAQH
jgi:hypothetical protein